jgi:quinolinate synthase
LGTPVICHGYHAHLNGKIGDVRSIDRETGKCEVHFEIITMEPQKIKAKYLRVLFELPECQNLDYRFTTDEVVGNGRYKLIQRVGKGTFGQVVNAMDMQTNTEVAIKIIKRSAPRQNFMLQAQTEIKVLTQIHSKDPRGQHCIGR